MVLVKKILLFLAALFLTALGIAVGTSAYLGTSPIGSFPYVLTFICHLSFGTTTFIVNSFFILFQRIILGKEFKKRDYCQFFVIFFFGIFIDFGMHIASFFVSQIYWKQFIMLIVGAIILAFGVALEIIADLIYIPGEGAVRAVSKKFGFEFGKAKIIFDIAQCIIAVLLGLTFLHKIEGIREGTLITALLVGPLVMVFCKPARAALSKIKFL